MALQDSSKTPEKQHAGARNLGELEFVVLQAIWTHEERGDERITVSDILPDVLRDWELAGYSTIATICSVLADKDLLKLETPIYGEHLRHMYRSVIPRDKAGTAVIVQNDEVVIIDDRTAK